ncbi:hypothetical protein [Vagococcus hydrophili]|uniref:hypothetical protein n=1 Tax=Vagococcus hydrophili TaxID=2714947 RepID=UPI0019323878|nr:hypothetical protein [Vagococcus hydrophili]
MFLSVSINTYIYLDIREKIENISSNSNTATKKEVITKKIDGQEENVSNNLSENEVVDQTVETGKTYTVSPGD